MVLGSTFVLPNTLFIDRYTVNEKVVFLLEDFKLKLI